MSTITYRAVGMTDDVTSCEHCGKDELKSTVRMVICDEDGNAGEEFYAGVVCAARLAGRKASAIRTEATRADRERKEARWAAWHAWNGRHAVWQQPLQDKAIGRYPRPEEVRAYRASDAYQQADAAFRAADPEPSYHA
jgi:hypothetical protein